MIILHVMKSLFFRRSLFVFLFGSLIAGTATAQYSSNWFGVRAGINVANETFSQLPDNSSTGMKVGALGGLTFEHWFGETWAVNASLLFDQKGVTEEYSTTAQNRQYTLPSGFSGIYSGDDNFALNYIEIPVLLKVAIGDGDVRPFLNAGPSFGLLLSASESTTGQVAPATDLKSYLSSTDVSLYIGGGIIDQLYRGPMITFDAGYAVGLTKIYKTVPALMTTSGTNFPAPIDPSTAKSGDIRITLGVMWKL